jgi:hypothetical protein
MTARPVPLRHWRSYGDAPLPSGPEALDEPLAAFPSWYLRIVCDRCGKEHMVKEVHMPQRDLRSATSSTGRATTAAAGARRRRSY